LKRVVHLIPYDGIGGVEEAARSMVGGSRDGVSFELRWLFPGVTSASQRRATHDPLRILRVGLGLGREQPDTLVVSLWRAAIAGCIAKGMSRRIRLVLFLHNSRDAHVLDRFATRLAAWMADAIWADSEATVQQRFGRTPGRPVTVISFLIRKIAPIKTLTHASVPRPVFAFWGRLAAQKNLLRALEIFARVRKCRPDAEFLIIGPDGGEAERLQAHAAALNIHESVRFLGPMSFDEIPNTVREAAFYLQSSIYEGMAISVTEGMQLGLLPVVTPVGEIANYCRHQNNAILIQDDEQATKDILEILDTPDRFKIVREQAIRTWTRASSYEDSVFDALSAISTQKAKI
jgi:glycosyltransferase involved in cell wall biosynthesis